MSWKFRLFFNTKTGSGRKSDKRVNRCKGPKEVQGSKTEDWTGKIGGRARQLVEGTERSNV
jgi:hypothetical protein